MKANKTMWMAAVAAGMVAVAAWGEPPAGTQPQPQPPQGAAIGERLAARETVAAAKARMGKAPALQGKSLTLLPVHGDADGYLESLLLDAMVQSGLTAVIPNDTADERFKRILKEIKWDEAQKRLETVDPATIDELGRLLSTQVLLEGRLMKSRRPVPADRRGRPMGWAGVDGAGAVEMELHLFAYEIATKKYAWSAVVWASEPEPPQPPAGQGGQVPGGERGVVVDVKEARVPLNTGVKVVAGAGSDLEAGLVETYARGRLADEGYRVGSGKDDDLTLTLETSCELFSELGNYRIYEGTLKARLELKGGEARTLGEASFPARGVRGLGEAQAHRNLADDMDAQLAGWLRRTLNPEAMEFTAARVGLTFAAPIETAEDFKAIETIQKGFEGLPGVRSAALFDQDNETGRVAWTIVYERAKLPTGPWNALLAANPALLDQLK
jgi:hypothetical protein